MSHWKPLIFINLYKNLMLKCKRLLYPVLFCLFVTLSFFVLYKAASASHARCKASNTVYKDYRFCINI